MTMETADSIIFSIRQLESIPQSEARDKALKDTKERVRNLLAENINAYVALGETVGWEEVEKVLNRSKEFIQKMKG